MKSSIMKRFFTTTIKKQTNINKISSSKQFFKNLPKVPMTKYLERDELSKDMLYSGYRPIMYPVKENPLFRNDRNLIINSMPRDNDEQITNTNTNNLDPISNEIRNDYLFGKDNCGGISTCGVNGIWKYSPTIQTNQLPLNIWNSSCMMMQIYKEWSNIPTDVIKNLKPFDQRKLQKR